MNPYEVLEVSPDVDQGTLRDAYRRLVRLHHPDLTPDEVLREQSHARMQRINQAWQIVGDPQKRATYDAAQTANSVRRPHPGRETMAPRSQPAKSRGVEPHRSKAKTKASAKSKKSKPAKPDVIVPMSPTRRKVERLKLARSPEAMRARNQQKLMEANFLRREGRLTEAIAACQSVLRNDFRSVAAREILGDIYLGIGETGKALVLLEQALALQKNNINLKRKISEIRAKSTRSGAAGNASPPKPAVEQNPKFREETIRMPIIPKPASGEPMPDGNFWRRLRGKLANRR